MSEENREALVGCLGILSVLVIIVGMVLLAGNHRIDTGIRTPIATPHIQHEIHYIEGMPCMRISIGRMHGWSCDWSKWEGNEGE